MTAIIRPRVWTQQPQFVTGINGSSDLVGTESNVILGSVPEVDIASGKMYTLAAGTQNIISAEGRQIYGKSNAGVTLPSVLNKSVPVTFAYIVKGLASFRSHQLYQYGSGLLWVSAGPKAQVQIWDSSLPGFRTITSGELSTTDFYKIVVTIDINNLVSLYVNGGLIGSVTVVTMPSDTNPEFGVTFLDGTAYGYCPVAFKTNKAWTQDEVQKWGRSPWQIFRPRVT